MKVLKPFYFVLLCFISIVGDAQVNNQDTVRTVLLDYGKLVKGGHLLEAINALSGLLKPNIQLTVKEKLAINNNLGVSYKNIGHYDIAINYYNIAESVFLENNISDNSFLVWIYVNKVNIYSLKGDFIKALEYAEKAIRSVQGNNGKYLSNQKSTHSLFLNAGIIYFQLNDFQSALAAFKKSIYLKDKYNLPGKDNVYLQLAKTYAVIGKKLLADRYFNLSISQSLSEINDFSINLVNNYLEYGYFLKANKENEKALKVFQRALDICLKKYGEKNTLTSNCYQLMGDYYRTIGDYQKSLIYYQKALVSGSKDFNDLNIEANPLFTDISLNSWQLRVLQRKAEVLAILADNEKEKNERLNRLSASLNTFNITIEVTNSIRVDYQDEETRLIFNEKQKKVFVGAVETALKIYDLTGDRKYLYLAYQTTQQYKANELKYEIARNKLFSNNDIPDSLRIKEKLLERDIISYSNLIRDESALLIPDTTKIAFWKDQQFDLKRSLEK